MVKSVCPFNTSVNGVGSLQAVVQTFMMKNGAEDRRFQTRRLKSLREYCSKIGGSLSVNSLFGVPEVTCSTIEKIFSEILGYWKVCTRWVPRMLTENHKQQRVDCSHRFLRQYGEKEELLDSIVTGDETWAFHFTPETKQQSREWRNSTSPKPKKFKQKQSASKVMATVFWDRKGILLIDLQDFQYHYKQEIYYYNRNHACITPAPPSGHCGLRHVKCK